jgi:cytidylate kinase
MNYRKTSSERMGDAVAQARRHWAARGTGEALEVAAPAPALPPWTIAISRQAGAGGAAVAQAVGERLGWPVYDRELIEKIADELGLRSELVHSADERKASWLAECLATISAKRGISEGAYTKGLSRVLFSLAAHGNCVIVGRGAAQLLPEATTLRIRLVAPLEQRVAALRKRHNLDLVAAQRWARERDQERRRFVQDHFHKDPDDATLYDLTLNSCRLGVADCTGLIVDALDRLRKAPASAAAAVLQPAGTAG